MLSWKLQNLEDKAGSVGKTPQIHWEKISHRNIVDATSNTLERGKENEQGTLTFKCSWASLTVFPSFFFFQLWPSFLKFLSILRSNNTIVPPVTFRKITKMYNTTVSVFTYLLSKLKLAEAVCCVQNCLRQWKYYFMIMTVSWQNNSFIYVWPHMQIVFISSYTHKWWILNSSSFTRTAFNTPTYKKTYTVSYL